MCSKIHYRRQLLRQIKTGWDKFNPLSVSAPHAHKQNDHLVPPQAGHLWRGRISCTWPHNCIGCYSERQPFFGHILSSPNTKKTNFYVATIMPNSNRRSRTITFAPTTMIVHHIGILDMTDEEIGATWILPHEKHLAQREAKETIKCMRNCPSQVTEENQMCERGLEHHRTPATKRTREAIKRSVCNAVLDEQDDQYQNSWTPNPEAIRQASLYISRASTERALRLAEADANYARSAQMSVSTCATREKDKAPATCNVQQEEDEMSSLSNAISRNLVMARSRASAKVLNNKKTSTISKKNTTLSSIVDASVRCPWSNMAA